MGQSQGGKVVPQQSVLKPKIKVPKKDNSDKANLKKEDSHKQENNFSPLKTSIVSGLCSWLGDVILYPLDTISTRLKGSKHKQPSSVSRYVVESIRRDGWKLYKGVALTLPHSCFPAILYVYTYEQLMRQISIIVDRYTDHKAVKLIFPFFASSIAEALCLVLELPFDTVRTRIQMNVPEYQYSSFVAGLREIKDNEGFLRFYKATWIFMACKTFYTATQFQSFEMLQYYFGGSIHALIINTIACAVIATTLVNPFEVLLTRYAMANTAHKPLLFKATVKAIIQREGLQGFYKGYWTETLIHSIYSLFWIPAFQLMREKYGVNIAA